MPNEPEEYDPIRRIAYLEKRLAEGESFLAKNPHNAKARAGYQRYWDEYATLKMAEEDDLKVTLALPDGVAYQPNGSAEAYSVVRVVFSGKRERAGDVTKEELAAMLEDVKLAREASV